MKERNRHYTDITDILIFEMYDDHDATYVHLCDSGKLNGRVIVQWSNADHKHQTVTENKPAAFCPGIL